MKLKPGFSKGHQTEEHELTLDLLDCVFILVSRADHACTDWLTWGLGSRGIGIAGGGGGEMNR